MTVRMRKRWRSLISAFLVALGLSATSVRADEVYVLTYLVSSGWYAYSGQTLAQCTSSETVSACQTRALSAVGAQLSVNSWVPVTPSVVSFVRYVDAPTATKDLFRDRVYSYTNASSAQQVLLAAQVSTAAKSRKEAVQDSASGDSAGNNLTCPAGGCPNPVTGVSASAIRGVDVPQPLQPDRIPQSAPYLPAR